MSAVCYLCHNEAGEITSVIRGDSEHMGEPTGSFIKYTGSEEVSTKWYIKDGVAKKKENHHQSLMHLMLFLKRGSWIFLMQNQGHGTE